MNAQQGSFEAANALAWLVSAGADVLVDDKPRNWLVTPGQAAAPATQGFPTAREAAPSAARAMSLASALAAAVNDLAALDAAISDFAHPLCQPRPPQLLTGNVTSGVFVIIDQPQGDDTPSALLMARMLAAIGLDQTGCAQACLLPWNTPATRAPREDEVAAFAPFIVRALALAAPRLVLAFGDKAAGLADRAVGAPVRGIASMRGKWLGIGAVPLMATFHPRQLLAQPELKKLAWADLQAFQQRMKAT